MQGRAHSYIEYELCTKTCHMLQSINCVSIDKIRANRSRSNDEPLAQFVHYPHIHSCFCCIRKVNTNAACTVIKQIACAPENTLWTKVCFAPDQLTKIGKNFLCVFLIEYKFSSHLRRFTLGHVQSVETKVYGPLALVQHFFLIRHCSEQTKCSERKRKAIEKA